MSSMTPKQLEQEWVSWWAANVGPRSYPTRDEMHAQIEELRAAFMAGAAAATGIPPEQLKGEEPKSGIAAWFASRRQT